MAIDPLPRLRTQDPATDEEVEFERSVPCAPGATVFFRCARDTGLSLYPSLFHI